MRVRPYFSSRCDLSSALPTPLSLSFVPAEVPSRSCRIVIAKRAALSCPLPSFHHQSQVRSARSTLPVGFPCVNILDDKRSGKQVLAAGVDTEGECLIHFGLPLLMVLGFWPHTRLEPVVQIAIVQASFSPSTSPRDYPPRSPFNRNFPKPPHSRSKETKTPLLTSPRL